MCFVIWLDVLMKVAARPIKSSTYDTGIFTWVETGESFLWMFTPRKHENKYSNQEGIYVTD